MPLHLKAIAWEAVPVIAGVAAVAILNRVDPGRHLARLDATESGILTSATLIVLATQIVWIFIELAKKIRR
jgi:hypothetical protein